MSYQKTFRTWSWHTKSYSIAEFKNESFYPCIIKLREGRRIKGFAILNNESEFKNYIDTTQYQEEELMIQEKLVGTEYTVSLVINRGIKHSV